MNLWEPADLNWFSLKMKEWSIPYKEASEREEGVKFYL